MNGSHVSYCRTTWLNDELVFSFHSSGTLAVVWPLGSGRLESVQAIRSLYSCQVNCNLEQAAVDRIGTATRVPGACAKEDEEYEQEFCQPLFTGMQPDTPAYSVAAQSD